MPELIVKSNQTRRKKLLFKAILRNQKRGDSISVRVSIIYKTGRNSRIWDLSSDWWIPRDSQASVCKVYSLGSDWLLKQNHENKYAFPSLNRKKSTTFELRSKVLTLENTKKSWFILYFARLFVPLQPISRGACGCRLRWYPLTWSRLCWRRDGIKDTHLPPLHYY